jgi:hypothetical protein
VLSLTAARSPGGLASECACNPPPGLGEGALTLVRPKV